MPKVRIKLQSSDIKELNKVCETISDIANRFEMRIHKRIIDMPTNDRVLHSIMRLSIPRSINIKIEMKD